MEKELSNDFRRLASLYVGKAGFSWETYGKLVMIYTYHEYAVSAYFSCRDSYSAYLSVTASVEHTNDPRWIMAENDYHAAIFGLYSNGGIVLDIMRNLNSCIGSLGDESVKDRLKEIQDRYRQSIVQFKDIRNNVAAHPFEEGKGKNTRFLTPVSTAGSSGGLHTIVFRMYDLDKKDFSEDIILEPTQNLTALNAYIRELCPVYESFLLG